MNEIEIKIPKPVLFIKYFMGTLGFVSLFVGVLVHTIFLYTAIGITLLIVLMPQTPKIMQKIQKIIEQPIQNPQSITQTHQDDELSQDNESSELERLKQQLEKLQKKKTLEKPIVEQQKTKLICPYCDHKPFKSGIMQIVHIKSEHPEKLKLL